VFGWVCGETQTEVKILKQKNDKLVTADLHVLSHYALSLPELVTGDGGEIIMANKAQSRLLQYWQHMCESMVNEPIDEVWIVGDLVQGLNPREFGKSKSAMLDDQAEAAAKIVAMLPKQFKIKIWSGTGYHESMDTQIAKKIVELLKNVGRKAEFRGSWSFEEVGNGKRKRRFFVTHESSTAVVYPHTPMLRDSNFFKNAFHDGKLPKVDAIVRAHKHTYLYIDNYIHVIQVPGWQLFTPYAKSLKMFPLYQPDIGAVIIRFDSEYRIKVQPWLYPPFIADEAGEIVEVPYEPARFVKVTNE
jgi:hypothetical protein